MQFVLKTERPENIQNLMRRIQYHFLGEKDDQLSFTRPIGSTRYPMFHIYLKQNSTEISINIHLDQKGPSYGKNTAHNGEYDGSLIEKEVERIKFQING
jgi:hypothetical protein